MFKSNKQKLESLEEHIDDLKLQYNALKGELDDLKSKHDEAAEAGSAAVEQLTFDISNLNDRYRQLDKWDDETRDKFRSLMDYFAISFTEGRSVVEREEEA